MRSPAAAVLGVAHVLALSAGCASRAADALPASDVPVPPPAAGAAEPPDAPQRPLALRDCIREALSRRGVVRRAEIAVLVARARTDETFAQILPRASLEVRGSTRSNDRGAVFSGSAPQVTGDPTVGTAALSFVVPIYDFGGSESRIDAADARTRAAGHDVVRARHDLSLAVSRAYYRVLEARRVADVVEESRRVVEAQLAVARDFERAGLVARSDVLTAEVQLARRRQEATQARANVQMAVETLNRIVGFDLGRPTVVEDVLEASAWDGPLGEALAAAAERRPELGALGEQIRAARAEHEATDAERRPGVFAFGALEHTTDSFTLNPDSASIGLGVRWSLFDGWATDARQRRTAQEVRELEEARAEAEADVALEVRAAHRDVRTAAERVPVARSAIALAEENLRVARDQYGTGLVTTSELLLEEERLAAARSAYHRSLYDYHDAVARLGHAVGADPLDDARTRP